MSGISMKLFLLTCILLVTGLVTYMICVTRTEESAPSTVILPQSPNETEQLREAETRVSNAESSSVYEQFIPETSTNAKKRNIYRLSNNYYVYTGPYDESQNTRQGRAKALFFAEQSENGLVVKYRSTGSGDAYNLTPFFL